MKILSFESPAGLRLGVVEGDQVVEAHAPPGQYPGASGLDDDVVVGHGPGCREGRGLAILELKHRAVACALDFARGDVDFAEGQREFLVATSVVEHVDVLEDAHHHEHAVAALHLNGLAVHVVLEGADVKGRHGVTISTWPSVSPRSRSTTSARSRGNVASIS